MRAGWPARVWRRSVATATITVACQVGGVTYTPLKAPPRPLQSRSAKSVEVFVSARPNIAFVEIGLIECRAAQGMDEHDVIDCLQREAGRVGCDAIVIVGGLEKEGSYGKLMYEGGGLRSSCVVYTGAPSSTTPVSSLPSVR